MVKKKNTPKKERLSRAARRARWLSIIFIAFTLIIIISMILSMVIQL